MPVRARRALSKRMGLIPVVVSDLPILCCSGAQVSTRMAMPQVLTACAHSAGEGRLVELCLLLP